MLIEKKEFLKSVKQSLRADWVALGYCVAWYDEVLEIVHAMNSLQLDPAYPIMLKRSLEKHLSSMPKWKNDKCKDQDWINSKEQIIKSLKKHLRLQRNY